MRTWNPYRIITGAWRDKYLTIDAVFYRIDGTKLAIYVTHIRRLAILSPPERIMVRVRVRLLNDDGGERRLELGLFFLG